MGMKISTVRTSTGLVEKYIGTAYDNVKTVADDIDNVNAVVDNIGSVNIVAPSIDSVNTVAASQDKVDTVADNMSDVNTVVSNVADVNIVADNINDVNITADNMPDINAVVENLVPINTNADNMLSINIAANNVSDIHNFTNVWQGAFPTDPEARTAGGELQSGDLYFNTESESIKVWNGLVWSTQAPFAGVREVIELASGQTDVTFTSNLAGANIFVFGTDVDNSRLLQGVDYVPDFSNNTLVLTQTYPAGSLLVSEQADVSTILDASIFPYTPDNNLSGSVGQALDNRQKVFDNVAAMQADSTLYIGQKVRTLGYHSVGDGGGNDYEIVAAGTGVDDGGSFIGLSGSGLQAKRLLVGATVETSTGTQTVADALDSRVKASSFINQNKRSVEHILPLRTDRYEEIIAEYGYSYIYPQSFWIDEDADEIWIADYSVGGVNNFAWVRVYDRQSLTEKTMFSAGIGTAEGIVLVNQGSQRNLFIKKGTNTLARYDVTELPDNLAVLVEEETYDISFRQQLGYRNGYWYCETVNRGANSYGNVINVYDDLNADPVFVYEIPLGIGGTVSSINSDYSNKLRKRQGIAAGDGFIALAHGGNANKGSADNVYRQQGVVLMTTEGSVIADSLCSASGFQSIVETNFDSTSTRIENEGCFVTKDNQVLALYVTRPGSDGKIIIVKEFSNEADAVDFSSAAVPVFPHIEGKEWRPSRAGLSRSSVADMINPVTGSVITTTREILAFLAQMNLTRAGFYSTSFPNVTMPNGDSIPSTSWVEVISHNNLSGEVHVSQFLSLTRKYRISVESNSVSEIGTSAKSGVGDFQVNIGEHYTSLNPQITVPDNNSVILLGEYNNTSFRMFGRLTLTRSTTFATGQRFIHVDICSAAGSSGRITNTLLSRGGLNGQPYFAQVTYQGVDYLALVQDYGTGARSAVRFEGYVRNSSFQALTVSEVSIVSTNLGSTVSQLIFNNNVIWHEGNTEVDSNGFIKRL